MLNFIVVKLSLSRCKMAVVHSLIWCVCSSFLLLFLWVCLCVCSVNLHLKSLFSIFHFIFVAILRHTFTPFAFHFRFIYFLLKNGSSSILVVKVYASEGVSWWYTHCTAIALYMCVCVDFFYKMWNKKQKASPCLFAKETNKQTK